MSSFGDLSQISDIHSISRISRSNSSRIIGRFDSLHNLLEYQSSIAHSASKSTANLNQGANHLEKITRSFGTCEESISEYVKSKIIFDCLNDASVNEKKKLPESVADKLKGLILIYELNKYMDLPPTAQNKQEKLCILGITDFPKYELNYEEKLNVKYCVEGLLREKIQDFIQRYESLGGCVKEVLKVTDYSVHKKLFESHDIQIMHTKDKIEEFCSQYQADILNCKTLINKWNELKYKETSKIYLENSEHLLLQAQVAEVQAKITKLTCIMRLFKETPITIDAYKILNAAVEEKLYATENEVRQKEDLKQQYENLQNTDYDDVLKTYLHYCKAIKKKKQILEKL